MVWVAGRSRVRAAAEPARPLETKSAPNALAQAIAGTSAPCAAARARERALMPDSRTHLVIGTPCYGGQVTTVYATSLLKLQQACLRRGDIDLTVMMQAGDALITRARQNLVAHFLENATATHLLFVDADIGFEPEQALRLLDCDSDMAAAVYPTKRIDWARFSAIAQAGHRHPESEALSYVLELETPERIALRGRFVKARYAGTGFLLIRRAALAAMIEHYPELRYTREHQTEDPLRDSQWRSALFNCMIDEATGNYLSEDFSFCRRWTDMGGEIWVDLESRLTHVGSIAFQGDYSSRFDKLPD